MKTALEGVAAQGLGQRLVARARSRGDEQALGLGQQLAIQAALAPDPALATVGPVEPRPQLQVTVQRSRPAVGDGQPSR